MKIIKKFNFFFNASKNSLIFPLSNAAKRMLKFEKLRSGEPKTCCEWPGGWPARARLAAQDRIHDTRGGRSPLEPRNLLGPVQYVALAFGSSLYIGTENFKLVLLGMTFCKRCAFSRP